MNPFYWLLSITGGVILLVLAVSFLCFRRVFYSKKRKILSPDEFEIPSGEAYLTFAEDIKKWTIEARALPHEDVSVRTPDGLTLRGKYYEYKSGAITEILFHGYRGSGERDLSAGIERCFSLGRNALIVDHRGSGRSDGHVISFGVKEKEDVLLWIDFAIEHFGKDVKIVLTGISMGAATVLMAAGKKLPENVKSVLADCPYSSQKDIIKKVIGDMKLPAGLLYPFVKLGALLFGGFNLDKETPLDAMAHCTLPTIFIHGTADSYVPSSMSEKLFKVCSHPTKKLVTIDGAAHGIAFPTDKEKYINALSDFEKEWNV